MVSINGFYLTFVRNLLLCLERYWYAVFSSLSWGCNCLACTSAWLKCVVNRYRNECHHDTYNTLRVGTGPRLSMAVDCGRIIHAVRRCRNDSGQCSGIGRREHPTINQPNLVLIDLNSSMYLSEFPNTYKSGKRKRWNR
eukprot:454903-Amphidinium_carterae.1